MTWFEESFRDHSSSMRVINYPDPEGETEPGQLRAGAHTDYGCMTILRTEAAPGGLQVQTRSGDWLEVEADDLGEIADHFRVSPFVIQHQLENRLGLEVVTELDLNRQYARRNWRAKVRHSRD